MLVTFYWLDNQGMDRLSESIRDRPKALSVGVIVGGVTAQSKVWREALTRLSRDLSGIAGPLDSDFRINFEFQIPGHIISPDFQGVRTGAFRKTDRHLKVQIAVPNDPPADPYTYGVHAMGMPWTQPKPGPCVDVSNSTPSHSGPCWPY